MNHLLQFANVSGHLADYSESQGCPFVKPHPHNCERGAQPQRFTEQSLDELFADALLGQAATSFISGGREKLYVFCKKC